MVAGPDLCSEAALEPCLTTAVRCVAWQSSPYGYLTDIPAIPPATLTPYLINPVTLEVTLGSPVSGPSNDTFPIGPVFFDDSTSVLGFADTTTASLYAVTRSGLSLAVSGAQQSRAISAGPHDLCRIDSSHFVRRYNPNPNTGCRIEVLSISGSTISLVHTETISGVQNATVDPSGLPSPMSNGIRPFHYFNGILYCTGGATGGSSTLFGPAILAVPFTISGGAGGAITLSTRAKDAQNVGAGSGQKIGSTEQMLRSSSGFKVGFYDDGTHMHFDATGASVIWIDFDPVNHAAFEGDTETPFGNYLAPNVRFHPQGTPIDSGPAIVSQSGETFSFSTITPQFLCPGFGADLSGFCARHESNLGAQLITNPFAPDGRRLLRAFKW